MIATNKLVHFLEFRLRSGVLQLSLGISLIIAILCSSMILLAYYSRLSGKLNEIEFRLQNNVASGLQYFYSFRKEFPYHEVRTIDLFGDGVDSVSLVRRPWGLYELVGVRAFQGTHVHEQFALIGSKPDSIGQSVICMPGGGGQLQLCGKTLIKGQAKLPQGGLNTGFIEGRWFERKHLIEGKALKMNRFYFPVVDTSGIHDLKEILSGSSEKAQVNVLQDLSLKRYPFELNRINVFAGRGYLELSDTLKGNLIISASGKIKINRDAVLIDVIIVAPTIEIESGFSGSAQFIAERLINVGKNSHLTYPSSLAIIGQQRDSLIDVGDSAIVEGVIAIPGIDLIVTSPGKLHIHKKAIIKGFIYVNANTEVQGEVWGHISTARFEARNNVNFLLDAVLDYSKKPEYLPASLLWGHSDEFKIIKWLR